MLVHGGNVAFKAEQARNVDAILALSDELYAACAACRVQYRPNHDKRRLAGRNNAEI